jgi:phosphoglycolate phosphatase
MASSSLVRVDRDAVLFDLDGVLVDSRAAFSGAVNAALLANGLPARPEEELYRYLGPPLHQAFTDLVVEQALVQPCVDAYRAIYSERAATETAVFPGMRELLAELSQRVTLVVATSKPRALAEPLLHALELRGFFAAVVGPELEAENERKTVTVARAIRELPSGARPVMVGDRSYDIEAAHENAIPAIGVFWGIGSEQELRAAGADDLARTPAELAGMLAPLHPSSLADTHHMAVVEDAQHARSGE